MEKNTEYQRQQKQATAHFSFNRMAMGMNSKITIHESLHKNGYIYPAGLATHTLSEKDLAILASSTVKIPAILERRNALRMECLGL